MWVFTRSGFVSVVLDGEKVKKEGDNPDAQTLIVRGRREADVRAVLDGLKGYRSRRVYSSVHTDYRFRAYISRREFADFLKDQAYRIDYTNFKSACREVRPEDNEWIDVLHLVWGAALRLTRPLKGITERGRKPRKIGS